MGREVAPAEKSFFHTTVSSALPDECISGDKSADKRHFGLNVIDGTTGTSDKSDVEHEQRKQRHFLMGINVMNPHLYTILSSGCT